MPSKETIDTINKLLGVELSPEQSPIVYDNHPIILVTGGWQSGKSFVAADYLFTRHYLGSYFGIVGADYDLCRQLFSYVREFGEKARLVKDCHFPARDQCSLTLSRGTDNPPCVIETKSAKYAEKIASKPYDGIIMEEAAQQPEDIFVNAQGRLITKGGWLLMVGTLEADKDWYVDKALEYAVPGNNDNGVRYVLPTWANRKVFPGGRQDPKIVYREKTLGPEKFMQKCGGELISPKNLVLPEFAIRLHVGNFPYNPDWPIFLAVDPGYSPSSYAVLFIQFHDDEVFIVDEIYQQRLVNEQIIQMVTTKPFFQKITDGVIDISAKKKDHEAKDSTWETWRKLSGLTLDFKRIEDVSVGVDRIRPFFLPHPVYNSPRIHIDKSCKGLISELGGCKSPFAEEGRGSWRTRPSGKPEDNNCDAAKALIYAIVSHYGLAAKRRASAVSYLN